MERNRPDRARRNILAMFGGAILIVLAVTVAWAALHPTPPSAVKLHYECVKFCF